MSDLMHPIKKKSISKLNTNTELSRKNLSAKNVSSKNVNVLVYCDDANTSPNSIKCEIKESKQYGGFLFDIWEYIAKANNYNCTYTTLKANSFKDGKTLKEAMELFTSSNKYNIMIGDLPIVESKLFANKTLFTRVLVLEKPIILYDPKTNTDTSIIDNLFILKDDTVSFFQNNTAPLGLLIILGIILGYFLHRTDKKARTLRSAIWGTIGAFLAEPGTIVELTNPKNKIGMLVSFIILSVAFYFAMYLQARATAAQVNDVGVHDPYEYSIKGKKIAVPEGNPMLLQLKRRGAVPALIPKKYGHIKQQVRYWLQKMPGVHGIILGDEHILLHNKFIEQKGLISSKYHFGYNQIGFVLRTSQLDHTLRTEINKTILHLNDKGITTKMCMRYWANDPDMCKI